MEQKGFFGKLFDFSFEEFVTPSIIRVVYIIILIVVSLSAIFFLIAGLVSGDGGTIVAALIFAPLFWLLYVILTRIWMEIVVVIFRIVEPIRDSDATLKRIEELLARQGGAPAAPVAPEPPSA